MLFLVLLFPIAIALIMVYLADKKVPQAPKGASFLRSFWASAWPGILVTIGGVGFFIIIMIFGKTNS